MSAFDEAIQKMFFEMLQSAEAEEVITNLLSKYLEENGYNKENSGVQEGVFTVSESAYQEIRTEMEKLKRQLDEKQKELNDFHNKIKDSNRIISWQKIQIAEKQNEIKELTDKNEQLSVELMQANNSVEEMKQLRQMEVESKNDIFEQKLVLKDKEIENKERIISNKDVKIRDLTDELDKRDTMYLNLLEEMDAYKDRNEVLECEKTQLFEELTMLQHLCEEKLGKGWRFEHDYEKMIEALAEDEEESEEEKDENIESDKAESKVLMTEVVEDSSSSQNKSE